MMGASPMKVASYSGELYAAVASLQPSVLRSSPPPHPLVSLQSFPTFNLVPILLSAIYVPYSRFQCQCNSLCCGGRRGFVGTKSY